MIPAILLTGFLGSGKTTALNRLIGSRPDLRIGVIENEAGIEGVDGDLLDGVARLVEITGGCACCTVRGALAGALELMGDRASELDLVVVEASGIADPVPIIQAFQSHTVRTSMRFGGIVGIVDAVAVANDEPRPRIWDLQIRLAGHLIVTKKDLIADTDLSFVESTVLQRAPEARLISSLDDPDLLNEVMAPRNSSLPLALVPESQDPGDDGGHGFTAHSLRVPPRLDPSLLDRWLTDLLLRPGIFRVKGAVTIAGMKRRYVIQGTPQMLELHPESESSALRRDRLVVIGTDIEPEILQKEVNECSIRGPDETRTSPGAHRHRSRAKRLARNPED